MRRQLERELGIIGQLGLAGYFLIVWDIVQFCAAARASWCRGAARRRTRAVCYALGITAVDPVRMELLFERFLSEERVARRNAADACPTSISICRRATSASR